MIAPDALLGTWVLHRFTVGFDDGRPDVAPFGDDATGMLVYAPDGHVAALLSRAPEAGVGRLEATRTLDAAAKVRAFDGSLAYAGTWRIDGDDVVHTVRVATVPGVAGRDQRRHVTLDAHGLTLTYALTPPSGVTRRYRLDWRRP